MEPLSNDSRFDSSLYFGARSQPILLSEELAEIEAPKRQLDRGIRLAVEAVESITWTSTNMGYDS